MPPRPSTDAALPPAAARDDAARPAAERLLDALARGRGELLALLAPPTCAACRAPLREPDAPLCVACRRALPWLPFPRCARCGLPAPCGRACPAREAAFTRAWAPLAYDGPARRLVAALKFRGALALAELMAAQIAATAPPGLLDPAATLVPVPLHPARHRARGFDQAARLAAALGARSGLPVAHALRRSGAATRQLGAGRADRLASGRLAITASGPVPPHAILLDDVHTTGATFDACARALRGAGARRVEAVAYARSLRR
jgi:predicted amidophosphoribosyltransferase